MIDNFEVVFFTDNNGSSPIVDFLDNCSDSLRSKIIRQLKYINEFGLSPQVPNIKKVAGTKFWELRILGKDNIRIFCIGKNKIIFVIHIFVKKKQKTPLKDLRIASERIKRLTYDIV